MRHMLDSGSSNGSVRGNQQALLSPALVEALTELASIEDLPVATLIALLLNEALSHRLHRSRS